MAAAFGPGCRLRFKSKRAFIDYLTYDYHLYDHSYGVINSKLY
jgi:hypothetical protein